MKFFYPVVAIELPRCDRVIDQFVALQVDVRGNLMGNSASGAADFNAFIIGGRSQPKRL